MEYRQASLLLYPFTLIDLQADESVTVGEAGQKNTDQRAGIFLIGQGRFQDCG